jgi:hypothetical protein
VNRQICNDLSRSVTYRGRGMQRIAAGSRRIRTLLLQTKYRDRSRVATLGSFGRNVAVPRQTEITLVHFHNNPSPGHSAFKYARADVKDLRAPAGPPGRHNKVILCRAVPRRSYLPDDPRAHIIWSGRVQPSVQKEQKSDERKCKTRTDGYRPPPSITGLSLHNARQLRDCGQKEGANDRSHRKAGIQGRVDPQWQQADHDCRDQ